MSDAVLQGLGEAVRAGLDAVVLARLPFPGLSCWAVCRAKWLTGRQAEAEEFLRLIVSSCSQLDGFLKELSSSLRNAGSSATAAALASVN